MTTVPMPTDTYVAILSAIAPWLIGIIIAGVLGWKLLSFGFDYLWSKFKRVADNEPGYVKSTDCLALRRTCQSDQNAFRQDVTESLNSFKKEVREGFAKGEVLFGEVRGILMITALKAGVDPEKLKDLTK